MAQHPAFPRLLRIVIFAFLTFARFRHALQVSHVTAEEETKHFITNSLGISKLIDFNSGVIAYKDHVEKSCYLEKMVTNSEWESSRMLIVYPRLLTIQQLQTIAGPTVSTFCFGWPSRILRQTSNLELRRKRSDPGVLPRRIRGQTQSQYLNYGKSENEGKAEAESHQLGSKAIVYGSNGMGQAQSQSGPFTCADCYSGGYLQPPGQVYSQPPQIGVKPDTGSLISGLQRPDQATIPSLEGNGRQPIFVPGTRGFTQEGTRTGGGIGTPSGIFVPGQQGTIYPGLQIPMLQKPLLPETQPGMFEIRQQIPDQVVGPRGEIGIPSGQQIPGQQGIIYPGQQVPLAPGSLSGISDVVQRIPDQIIAPRGEIAMPGGQVIPGQQGYMYPGQQVPIQQKPLSVGTQPTLFESGQRIPDQVVGARGEIGVPSGQIMPGQQNIIYPGQHVPLLQKPLSPETQPGIIDIGQHIPGQIARPGGEIRIPSGKFIPGQQGNIYSGQQVPQFQMPAQPGIQQGPIAPIQTISGQPIHFTPGTSIQKPQQVLLPGQLSVTQGPGYYESVQKPIIHDQQPSQVAQHQGQYQGPSAAKGSFAGQLSGLYESSVGQSGRFSGTFQGNYAHDAIHVGRYPLPGQVQSSSTPGVQQYIPGTSIYAQQPGYTPPLNIQYPGQSSQIGTAGYPVGQQGQDGQISQLGQVRPDDQVRGGQIGQTGKIVPGAVTIDGGTQLYPQYPGQAPQGGQQTYQGPGRVIMQPGQGQLVAAGQQMYQVPGVGVGDQLPSGGQQIHQEPGAPSPITVVKQPSQVQLPSVSQQYPYGTFQPGLYQQPIQYGQQTSDQQLSSPGQVVGGGQRDSFYGPPVSPGAGAGQLVPATDDGNSEAQTNVQRINNETQASASSSGRFAGGTAQSQVSGSYSGEGSFSASAGSDDGLRGAQTQITGNSAGTLSASQGSGGKSKSQTQVELNADTGDTIASGQTGGLNHGTNTQIQSGIKGGMADAQANGPGSTSSQAQIGFLPYNAESEQEDPRNPHNGGASASAGSGTHAGKSQVQISGKYAFGIKYTGQAQASSANTGFTAQEIALPTMKPISFDFHLNKQDEKHTSTREINNARILQLVTSTTPPAIDMDLKNLDYDEDYDDLHGEDETSDTKKSVGQQTRSIQGGSHGMSIPTGFRARISEDAIYAAGVRTNRLKSPEDIGYGSGYAFQPSYAPLQFGFKSAGKPKFVSVSKSETGSRNVLTGKKTPSVYYTQSSTCGFFTNSCFYSNGKKTCLPKPKANADGTPMLCKN